MEISKAMLKAMPTAGMALGQFRQWVAKEATRIKDEEGIGSLRLQGQLLAFWAEHRPKMTALLGPLLPDLAIVLTFKMEEAEGNNLKAGMFRTDAREEAEKDWLLMEEEEPELEDQDLP